MTRQSVATAQGLPVVARIVAHAGHAHAPSLFTTAPVPAIRKVLEKAGWNVDDVDLFEINEAFAVVAMIAAKDLGIPDEKLNVNGGATALGHPIAHRRHAARRPAQARFEARRGGALHRGW